MCVDYTLLDAAGLDLAFAVAPQHLSFPLLAVRDAGCRYAMVGQGPGGFLVPSGRPAVLIVGDDTDFALEPDGFCAASLAHYLARCAGVAVVSSVSLLALYCATMMWASMLCEDVAIIETRPERKAESVAFVREAAPAATMVVTTVEAKGTT